MKRIFLCCLAAMALTGCVSNKVYKAAVDESEARRGQIEKARQELEQARQSLENSGKELEGSRQANEKLKKDMEDLTAAKDKEISSLKSRLDELSSKGTTTSKEVQSLRQERERLSASDKAKAVEIERLKQEITAMTKAKAEEIAAVRQELKVRADEIAAIKQDAERLVRAKEEEIAAVKQEKDGLASEKEYLNREIERLKVKAGEISSEKEKEISNVKSTYETLVKEMQKEIEKGDIKITQAVDRLSVNLVEKILFDSGEAEVKPEGLNILKRVGDILKGVSDKQIRIEGYTDNVKLGARLRQRYPTNWELSTARATNVVRYLQDKVGVDPRMLSAAGLSEYKPVASNETPEGRAQNRRIEIVLLPLDVDRVLEELKK